MLVLYNFKIYYYKGKKNLTDPLSCRSDYAMKNDVEEEKKNFLRDLILRKVRFKDLLTADYSKKEEFQSVKLLIKTAVKVTASS